MLSDDPYTEESYGGFLGAPPTPITEYNSTDGYFCVSSVLTQLSAYFGTELTLPYITSIATGENQTAYDLATSIEANVICNDCIFAALALIEQEYPEAGSVPFDIIFGAFNLTSPLPEGTTINEFANDTCAYEDRSVPTGESRVPSRIPCLYNQADHHRWYSAREHHCLDRQLDVHPVRVNVVTK